ncbi:SCP2 sterol-binding domain-containing protein [Sciscionella marina]|uniref:SCP2 sterol-binding domain-containing protein n=1 Tax=Sciscionella marina TaxID=508770 RepID=UPI000366A8DB|nr:SCP2 sterol-binding domain-containing protein [Sciscionella marina]
MPIFADTDEVNTYIGKMFESVVDKPEFVTATEGSGLVVRLNYTDPDTVMLVDFPGQQVSYGEEAASATNATVDLYMKSDDAHSFWLGKLNFPVAMARKKVTMEGSTAKALKLLPLTKPLFAAYEGLLRESGRNDLIEKG